MNATPFQPIEQSIYIIGHNDDECDDSVAPKKETAYITFPLFRKCLNIDDACQYEMVTDKDTCIRLRYRHEKGESVNIEMRVVPASWTNASRDYILGTGEHSCNMYDWNELASKCMDGIRNCTVI